MAYCLRARGSRKIVQVVSRFQTVTQVDDATEIVEIGLQSGDNPARNIMSRAEMNNDQNRLEDQRPILRDVQL